MDTRNTILDAAERVFSRNGFSGAAMREIAAEAKVSQALLHYHFKSKAHLYNDVFERRAADSVRFRAGSIEELFDGGKRPELRELISVLFATPPEWGGTGQANYYFTPMVSALAIGEDDRSKEMMSRLYDPFALRFIEALKQVVPVLDHKHSVQAYLFALGVRTQVYARNGRAERLIGTGEPINQNEYTSAAIDFAVAGIKNMAARVGTSG